jgi:ABC-type sugar transport system substrate-binding protein
MTKFWRALGSLVACAAVTALVACGSSDSGTDDAAGDGANDVAAAAVKAPADCERHPEFPVVAPAGTNGEKYEIVVIMPHTLEGYTQSVKWGAQQEGKKLGVDVTVQDAGGYANIDRQIGLVESAITRKVDAIVIYPNDPSALSPVIKQGADAGIKMLGLISPGASGLDDYPGLSSLDTILTSDYRQNAFDVTTCLAKAVGGKGEFYDLQGGAGSAYQKDSTEGVEAALKDFPDMKLVGKKILPGFGTADATRAIEDALAANPNVNAMYCDTMTLTAGCAAAITAADKHGKVALGGIDPAGPDDVTGLRNGDYTVVLGERPTVLGRGAVDLAVQVLNGESVPERIVVEQNDLYTAADKLQEDLPVQLAPFLLEK